MFKKVSFEENIQKQKKMKKYDTIEEYENVDTQDIFNRLSDSHLKSMQITKKDDNAKQAQEVLNKMDLISFEEDELGDISRSFKEV